jgi:hypothetical protein
MTYILDVYFTWTTIFGKQSVKMFTGGSAKRKLKKEQEKQTKKGIKIEFEIIDLPNNNVKWILKSDSLKLLEETEAELTTAVDEQLRKISGGSVVDRLSKIKMLGIGEKIAKKIDPNKIGQIIAEGKDHILVSFEYWENSKGRVKLLKKK